MYRTLLAVVAFAVTARGLEPSKEVLRNWPQWRGPLAIGVAPEANPPVEWSETKNVRWKVKIPGRGNATPIVWENQVFILTAVAKGPSSNNASAGGPPPQGGPPRGQTPTEPYQFIVMALDRQSGKVLWRHIPREQVPVAGHHQDNTYASGSPITDGEHLIAHFGSHGTYGYDLKGKLLWEKDLGDQKTRNDFGEGTSPALHGNTVLVLWDHEGVDFIVALDKRDGRELWRATRDEPTGWTTPFIIEHQGKAQAVVNGSNRVRSYDLATGKLLWECSGQTANAIPSAVGARDMVYVTSGFRGSALQAIRLGGAGDLTGKENIVWSHNKNTPYAPSPLLYEGLLYLFSGNNATLTVFEAANGNRVIDGEKIEGMQGVYASACGAAGRVYLVGRDGGTVVIKQGPKYEVLSTNRLEEGFDATPAMVGDELFLRGHEYLYCLGTKR